MTEETAAEQPTLDEVYDETDEAFFPVGEPSPEEVAEQQLLDEMPLPGFPVQEVERRAKWAAIPRRARAAIRRLHHMLGHKPREVMIQIMKGSHAPQEYIDAIKYFRCDA